MHSSAAPPRHLSQTSLQCDPASCRCKRGIPPSCSQLSCAAAEAVSAAEFARAGRCKLRFADMSAVRQPLCKLRLHVGVPRAIRSLLHRSAAVLLLRAFCRGRRPAVGDCCNAVRQRTEARRRFCGSFALHTDPSTVCTLSGISIFNRQYFQGLLCHCKPSAPFTFDSSNSVLLLIFSNEVDYLRWVVRWEREQELSVSWQRTRPAEFSASPASPAMNNTTTRNLSLARSASEAELYYLLLPDNPM